WCLFFFSSRRRHTRSTRDWSSDVCSSDLIGRHGAALVPDHKTVLTHCNAGALATAGYGTALGVIRAACESGKRIDVFAGETRPRSEERRVGKECRSRRWREARTEKRGRAK